MFWLRKHAANNNTSSCLPSLLVNSCFRNGRSLGSLWREGNRRIVHAIACLALSRSMLSPEVVRLSEKEHKSIFCCIHHISFARTEGIRRTVYLKLDLQRSQSQLKDGGAKKERACSTRSEKDQGNPMVLCRLPQNSKCNPLRPFIRAHFTFRTVLRGVNATVCSIHKPYLRAKHGS